MTGRRLPSPGWAVAVARAVAWAWRSVGSVRVHLRDHGGVSAPMEDPPRVSASGIRGVNLAVRLRRASCLERSLVLQRWYLSQGRERTIIIGVALDGSTTLAHAWLEGEEHRNDRAYIEMTRVPAS